MINTRNIGVNRRGMTFLVFRELMIWYGRETVSELTSIHIMNSPC